MRWTVKLAAAIAVSAMAGSLLPHEADAQTCPGGMRKIAIGIATSPPNVVHTSPYVAKAMGFFAKRCIEPNLVQFEGAYSPTSIAAVSQGTTLSGVNEIGIGRGLKVKQVWALAPRLPQTYVVAETVKTAADLKGKKLSATGGGVGGFQWRLAREILKTANLTVDDVIFVNAATAGRVPGLLTGQIDGVALAPEDAFIAKQQKPSINFLINVVDLLPQYMYNVHGASLDLIARDRALVRDSFAALIEANRLLYTDPDKVMKVVVDETQKPADSVKYALDFLAKNCIWSVNHGLYPKNVAWNIENSVASGDLDAAHAPAVDQVADFKLAEEAVEAAGGRTKIGACEQ